MHLQWCCDILLWGQTAQFISVGEVILKAIRHNITSIYAFRTPAARKAQTTALLWADSSPETLHIS